MKKALALFLVMMTVSITSMANPNHRMGSHRHHGHNGWIGPLVIGGVLGYALSQPRPVIVQQPGVIYPNQLPPAPYGYRYEQMVDYGCNCYRWVLVPY